MSTLKKGRNLNIVEILFLNLEHLDLACRIDLCSSGCFLHTIQMCRGSFISHLHSTWSYHGFPSFCFLFYPFRPSFPRGPVSQIYFIYFLGQGGGRRCLQQLKNKTDISSTCQENKHEISSVAWFSGILRNVPLFLLICLFYELEE